MDRSEPSADDTLRLEYCLAVPTLAWKVCMQGPITVRERRAVGARRRPVGTAPGRRGRPRSARVREAVLEATLAMLSERGMSGLTVEGVAARAGVGKATLYRRWRSKLPLVLEAVTSLPELSMPASGTLQGDLREILLDLARIFRVSPCGRVLAQLAAERGSDAALDAAVRRFVAVRRKPVVDVLRAGMMHGKLPSDLDPDTITDMLVGPIVNRLLFTHRPAGARFVDQVIATVLAGASSGASAASLTRAVKGTAPARGLPGRTRRK